MVKRRRHVGLLQAPTPQQHEPAATAEAKDSAGGGAEAEYIFAPSGNGYFIKGFGESGHFGDLKGLANIARLIRTPGHPVSMLELIEADAHVERDRGSRQPAIETQKLREFHEQLRELRADLDRAKAV